MVRLKGRMSLILAGLLICSQTLAQEVYIPGAKTGFVFLGGVDPVLLLEAERAEDRKVTGCVTSSKWEGSSPYLLATLRYYTYSGNPRKTTRELAEGLFVSAKELAEMMAKTTQDDSFLNALKQKFTDRTVVETKVSGYSGWLDSYEDKLAKVWRRSLAWGDSREQWRLELVGSNEIPPVKDLLKTIVSSVEAVKFDDDQVLKELPIKPQKLPGLMCSMSAPGVFQVYARDPLDKSRPGGQGFAANLPMGAISAVVYASKYGNSGVSSTLKTAQDLQRMTIMPEMKVLGSKVRPVTLGGVSGHEFALSYEEGGVATYYCGVALAQKGREWILHVQASKAAGGEKKVRSILESFVPR